MIHFHAVAQGLNIQHGSISSEQADVVKIMEVLSIFGMCSTKHAHKKLAGFLT